MKKILALIVLLSAINANAASTQVTVAATGMSNLVTVLPSMPLKVSQIILTAPADDTASVTLYDIPTKSLVWTNSAYTTISSYATNYYQVWTNYLGATNYSKTNVALITVTNTVAASTNNVYVPVYKFTAPTNGSVTITGLSQLFMNGMWITNTGTGSASLTVSYTQ